MAIHKFGKWEYSDEEIERMHEEAVKRGEERMETEPRAEAAYYDRALDRIIVALMNGCTFIFPPDLAQGLRGASVEELSEVRILGPGFALSWDKLDVQFSVGGLMKGRFGNKRWMAALKRRRPRASVKVNNAAKVTRARKVG